MFHPAEPLKLVIIDHCSTLRFELERAFEEPPQIQVVGSVSCLSDLVTEVNAANIDLALVAIDFPDGGGLDICRWMATEYPETKILLLSSYNWETVFVAARYIQAEGVLFRNMQTLQIIAEILKAIDGPIFTSEQQKRILAWESRVGHRLHSLTGRDWKIIRLILSGLPVHEMARRLSLSQNVFDEWFDDLLQKLALPSQALLLAFCLEEHLDILVPLADRLCRPVVLLCEGVFNFSFLTV